MGNMKEFEVSGDVSPGSTSLSNKGFEEEPFFPAKTFFNGPFSLVRGKRRWSTGVSGLETLEA